MNMTLEEQFRGFCLSVGMGGLLGILLDLFRLVRIFAAPSRRSQFVLDVLYMLLCSGLTFVLSLAIHYGQLRFYMFLGEGIGFAAYMLAFGRIVPAVGPQIQRAGIHYIWQPWKKYCGFLRKKMEKCWEQAKESVKKLQKSLKRP